MSELKERNHYTPEQKYKIVKEALTKAATTPGLMITVS